MMQTIKNLYHLGQAILANLIYGFPSRDMFIIGVTGTDGKTTTVNLIYHILKSSGVKVGMLSTINAEIGTKEFDTGLHVTTPDPFLLQKILKTAKQAGLTHFVLEVTSHGLDQNRVWGVEYNVGVITNVTHEHLDYHKTYERYLAAKMKLLERSKERIVNKDDNSYKTIQKKFMTHVTTYGLDKTADINPQNFSFSTQLQGEFNTYNILAASSAARFVGLSDEHIKKAIKTFEVPLGRQNIVYDKNFKVMVDFAHTPNSVEQILKAERPLVKGRLIHVFGSAGERDVFKRPLMGEASSNYADIIILTAEDPRDESIQAISNKIAQGIDKKFVLQKDTTESVKEKTYYMINDRQEAINFAVKIAQKDDLVIITGKGHEQSMNYGQGEIPWDEKKAVEKALKEREND